MTQNATQNASPPDYPPADYPPADYPPAPPPPGGLQASSVHAAICAVRRAVPYVQKQRSQGMNYSFVGIENVLNELRPVLDQAGLSVIPVRTRVVLSGEYKTSKGAVMQRIVLRAAYRITHAASDTSVEVEAVGEASDSGDKATPKAMTSAQKAMLRQVFLLESGDLDPDTYLSQELGADYERVKTAQKSLASARNSEELEKCWGVVQTRPFSAHQMQSLRVAYEQTRARLAGRPQAAPASLVAGSPVAANPAAQPARNGATPRRPISGPA
jgi:hypothetical protein